MATQAKSQEPDDVAEMQSLLRELAGALEAEQAAQRKLIDTLRQAEAEGERQRRELNG